MRLLFRAPETVVAVFGFSLLLVVVSSFAFRKTGYHTGQLLDLTPGVLWVIYLFTGVVSLNLTFASEKDGHALLGLSLTGVNPSWIFLSKAICNICFIVLVQSFVFLVHGLLFGVDIFPFFSSFMALSFLVSIGFGSLGTLLSSLAAATRGKEVLLPLVLFPLCLPLLGAAVFLSRELFQTGALSVSSFWFICVIGYDIIAVTLSATLYEFVLRE